MRALKEVVVNGKIYAAGAELPPLDDSQYRHCVAAGVIEPISTAQEQQPEKKTQRKKKAQ